MSRRQEILAAIRDLPGLPTSATEVLQLAQDPDVDMGRLVAAVEHDASLTANLLRVANSALFGATREVATVREAVVRIGIRRISELAAAIVIAPRARKAVRGYALGPDALWLHSATVAAATMELAAALDMRLPPHAFTAGLLHDVGKIVLGAFLDADGGGVLALVEEQGLTFEAAEHEALGIDHAEAGAVLLEVWNLPAEIVEVVRWHHDPEQLGAGADRALDLVHIADTLGLVAGVGTGRDGLNYRPSPRVVGRLGLTSTVCELVVCRTLQRMQQLQELFTNGSGR